ncbi:hypothetical protein, partial [Actinomyces gerencseriae]|uniref:hypothetical protein n=1 Tax=Actinomyces gerencseriae TaxID=52769 RepID=UPI0028E5654A
VGLMVTVGWWPPRVLVVGAGLWCRLLVGVGGVAGVCVCCWWCWWVLRWWRLWWVGGCGGRVR